MFKLLRNYIREQKNNLLQVLGLGFLVVIMIVAFLAINFSNTYLSKQYSNDIIHNNFNQYSYFKTLDEVKFSSKNSYDAYLENMEYYDKNNNVIKSTLENATFQLQRLDSVKHTYRFIFAGGDTNSPEYFAIGKNLATNTSKTYIDFKVNIPFNYPTIGINDQEVQDEVALLDKYVYDKNKIDKTNLENKTNFMITSDKALKTYNDEIYHKQAYPYANKPYTDVDINNEAKLYSIMTMGMLYKNIQYMQTIVVNDLLITGKNFAFIQSEPSDFINQPIITQKGGASLNSKPLQNNEILIYKQFAKFNHLHIGQTYVIAGKTFIIRGYVTSSLAANPGYYFPTIDFKNNTVAFANSNTMLNVKKTLAQFSYISENRFLPSKPDLGTPNIDSTINNSWLYDYLHEQYNQKFGKTTYHFNNGIDIQSLTASTNSYLSYSGDVEWSGLGSINNRISLMNQISSIFLFLIFVVTVIIIFIITFKMIDRNKKLIGVLKATGYKSWQLSLTLVVSIVVPLIMFAVIGVVISIPIAHFIVTTNINFLALINYGWYFNISISILVIVIPITIITIISFLLVLFLLRIKPLDLITNNISTKKYNLNIGVIFSFISHFLIRKFTYRNKLAITTSMRSLGKTLIMSFTSIFAATLVFFALVASGLVTDMLGSQFSGVNFNYQNTYQFTDDVKDNFFTSDNKLMYKFDSVNEIKNKSSLYPQFKSVLEEMIKDPQAPAIIDFRDGYIMGSELLKIRREIVELNFHKFPPTFQQFWTNNIVLINYLTNNNGQNNTDLMVSFGVIPYENNQEVPYTQLEFDQANTLDLNKYPNIYYDNQTQKLSDDAFKLWGAWRTAYGINDSLNQFLNPNFAITNFDTFSNLTLSKMETSTSWQDKQFIKIRNELITSLGIKNPDSSSVQFIPMATSSLRSIPNLYDGGEKLGKTIIYTIHGLDKQTKYIIGISYDNFSKLQPNIALLPQKWLNSIILGTKDNNSLNSTFANSKLSKFSNNELQHYLPIVSTKNDYKIDLSQVVNNGYLESKGISSSLSLVYDINNLRSVMNTNQYSLQAVISFFGVFSVILAFMIIIIITNIFVRDNLILINILRSLGYTAPEVSYNFFFIVIPVLVISSLFSVFIVPMLVNNLATLLTSFAKIVFPVVFRWWYFAVMVFINIIIYFVSYVITWKLNINNKQLMTLTK
ncbi:ABC transporter permease [Spiroplasma endosymbiont of Virgichneumon dumeticola]|uniref:ABC transporter permease n=1 Tax=Spiroplasma endosymbiont of Virgichneumon dumeticola TaxID=3139323 RepID=UPI0035C8ADDA